MNFSSGNYNCFQEKCGIFFWGIHGHDALWHFALIENAFKSFPFRMPIYSGSELSGYNFLYDLLIFLLTKAGIPIMFSYFKLFPIVWFIVFTAMIIVLARKIKDKPLFVGLFLFLTYFTGSFSYYFTLAKDKTIWGSAGLLAQMVYHLVYNPQFSLSLLGILYVLIKIIERKNDLRTMMVLNAIVFINLGLKFYGGVVTAFMVFLYISFEILSKKIDLRKYIKYIFILSVFTVAAIVIFYYRFQGKDNGSVFAWSPFALVHPITEDPSLFYLRKITDARYFLESQGIGPRLVLIELLNLSLFLFFYLGVRFFGVVYLLIKIIRKKSNAFDAIVGWTMFGSTLLSILLVQKAEWWNTIQFFYYTIFLSTIYISEFAYKLMIKKKIWQVLSIMLLILAVPTTIDIIKGFSAYPGHSYLPLGEYEALQFLKKQPDGVVLTTQYDDNVKTGLDYPQPLYAYSDTSYVSAFSSKVTYLNDIVQLRLIGIDYLDRMKKIKSNDCAVLKEVDYIYFNNDNKINTNLFNCSSKLEMIYGNRTASVYKVSK